MNLSKTILASLILFLTTNAIIAQQTTDKEAITATINNYFEGSRTDNPELLKKAFHPEATLKYINANEYKMLPIQKFFSFFTNTKTRTFEDKIFFIDITGNAANVKLSTKYKTYQYTDYMNMLKTKDGWKIVSKISYKEVF